MTTLRSHKKLRLILIPLAFSAVAASGCTAWDVHELPAMPFVSKPPKEYRPVGVSLNLQASDPAEIYHSVNQARAENGVVLQIVGDDKSPIRVLPLPPGQRTVYVSDLLDQTGVIGKLKSVEATLFRHSADTIGGIPMVVKMTDGGKRVKPESDYALRAGDRLKVKKYNVAINGVISAVLGL
jgi:hypothetical protein